MSEDLGVQLTLDELSKFKKLNTDMLPELVDFYNKNKNKFNNNGNNNNTNNRPHKKHYGHNAHIR